MRYTEKERTMWRQYGTETTNPHDAFNDAIADGLMNPKDYMYMYSTESQHYFKHVETRKYMRYKRMVRTKRRNHWA